MPRKPKNAKKSKRRPAKKSKRKAKLQSVVVRNTHHNPMPDRLSDQFEFRINGYIGAGIMNSAGWGTGTVPGVVIGGNCIASSVTGTSVLANAAAALRLLAAANGVVYTATTGTAPAGFRAYFNTTAGAASLFQRYTVTKFDYSITFAPQSLGDTLNVVCVPEIGLPAQLQTNTNYGTVFAAGNAPWAKYKTVGAYNNLKTNTVKGSIDVARFLGIPRKQLLTDIAYSGFNNDNASTITLPGTNVILVIYVQTADGAATSNAISYDLMVNYHVTFAEPSTATLVM